MLFPPLIFLNRFKPAFLFKPGSFGLLLSQLFLSGGLPSGLLSLGSPRLLLGLPLPLLCFVDLLKLLPLLPFSLLLLKPPSLCLPQPVGFLFFPKSGFFLFRLLGLAGLLGGLELALPFEFLGLAIVVFLLLDDVQVVRVVIPQMHRQVIGRLLVVLGIYLGVVLVFAATGLVFL